MDPNYIQVLVNQARAHKKERQPKEALSCYKEAGDLLLSEARSFARNNGGVTDVGDDRIIGGEFFGLCLDYLRQDKVYATILNNMGVLYAESGQYGDARKCFTEAVQTHPMTEKYIEALQNLQALGDT